MLTEAGDAAHPWSMRPRDIRSSSRVQIWTRWRSTSLPAPS